MLHTGLELISRFDLNGAIEIILNIRYLGIPFPPAPKSKKTRKKSERNQQIIERYVAGDTLAEIASDYSISEQRVHQIVNDRRK